MTFGGKFFCTTILLLPWHRLLVVQKFSKSFMQRDSSIMRIVVFCLTSKSIHTEMAHMQHIEQIYEMIATCVHETLCKIITQLAHTLCAFCLQWTKNAKNILCFKLYHNYKYNIYCNKNQLSMISIITSRYILDPVLQSLQNLNVAILKHLDSKHLSDRILDIACHIIPSNLLHLNDICMETWQIYLAIFHAVFHFLELAWYHDQQNSKKTRINSKCRYLNTRQQQKHNNRYYLS